MIGIRSSRYAMTKLLQNRPQTRFQDIDQQGVLTDQG